MPCGRGIGGGIVRSAFHKRLQALSVGGGMIEDAGWSPNRFNVDAREPRCTCRPRSTNPLPRFSILSLTDPSPGPVGRSEYHDLPRMPRAVWPVSPIRIRRPRPLAGIFSEMLRSGFQTGRPDSANVEADGSAIIPLKTMGLKPSNPSLIVDSQPNLWLLSELIDANRFHWCVKRNVWKGEYGVGDSSAVITLARAARETLRGER